MRAEPGTERLLTIYWFSVKCYAVAYLHVDLVWSRSHPCQLFMHRGYDEVKYHRRVLRSINTEIYKHNWIATFVQSLFTRPAGTGARIIITIYIDKLDLRDKPATGTVLFVKTYIADKHLVYASNLPFLFVQRKEQGQYSIIIDCPGGGQISCC